MIIKKLSQKVVVSRVKKAVNNAQKEILATMLLSQELENPLPKSYHSLLVKKTLEGVKLQRLGFGTKEEYNQINSLYLFSKNYNIKHVVHTKKYQRMIVVDRKILFFGVEDSFFTATYRPLILAFVAYFESL